MARPKVEITATVMLTSAKTTNMVVTGEGLAASIGRYERMHVTT